MVDVTACQSGSGRIRGTWARTYADGTVPGNTHTATAASQKRGRKDSV